MIDEDGYRLNIGIILCNAENKLFWARRTGQDGWQFPQGGMKEGEKPDEAMYRELHEEVGLERHHVKIITRTGDWFRYDLPERFIRYNSFPLCIGQKQIWYLLRFIGDESDIRFDCSDTPEFDDFRWVEYWEPAFDVVYFKRSVYMQALTEMWGSLFPGIVPSIPNPNRRNDYVKKSRKG